MCQKGNISYCNEYNTKLVLDNLKNADGIMYITAFSKEYNMYREIYNPDKWKIQQLGIEHYFEYIFGDILYTDDKKSVLHIKMKVLVVCTQKLLIKEY